MSKYAFVFPGQGSQQQGMLANFATSYPVIHELYQLASDCLDYDLWQLTQEGPADQLNQTEKTQPALLVAGVAMWNIWQKINPKQPDFLAGHSLGEYTALVCAGALDFEVAVKLVAARGRFMQAAVPIGQGAMAAIVGLNEKQVEDLCIDTSEYSNQVAPANYNSPGQVVIAGEAEAVQKAMDSAKNAGAKLVMKLPMSVPSHCILMKSAAEQLGEILATITIQSPHIPVINNVDVAINDNSEAIKKSLIRQLYSPVRWVETIQYMVNQGVVGIIESGPGKVLMGLNKRITPTIYNMALINEESLQEACQQINDQVTTI